MESINIQLQVSLVAEGDKEAFKILYEHLVTRVFSYVVTRVDGRATATDVTQDVFIELHKSFNSFSYVSDGSFYSFVFTIVRRQLAKRYGEQKKRAFEEFDEQIHHEREQGSVETVVSIQSALGMLDECSREIIVLHHWSRFTFAEIGELINMKESAVRVRHHRAKAMLASLLQA